MAKIIDILNNAKKTLFSFEILPPKKGESLQYLIENITPLMEFKPRFIDVTYHREEYVYEQFPGGLLKKKTTRKRPGTVGICAALMNRFDVLTVPHIICGGFSREETENALIDLNFLDIDNIMVLRGDAIKSESSFRPQEEGHQYASELLEQVININQGKYLDEHFQHHPTDFCIGVAGYPEKHFESPNMTTDLKFLKLKADLGAHYIVTQMFFDNQKYFQFVDNCRREGITIPIIPGIKPLTSKKQIIELPRTFHIDIPADLADAIDRCRDDKEAKQIGIEWAIAQAKELVKHQAPCIHFFCMGKGTAVQKIASELF